MLYVRLRIMKLLVPFALAIATLFTFSACGPRTKVREQAAPGPKPEEKVKKPTDPTLPPDGEDGRGSDDSGTTKPKPDGVIPPVPPPTGKPEYGIKIEGKPNQIRSPYDPQGRPIDVRGLPPGTEIECPFTPGRHLLVP
jgi:hypothetical protein